ncbi:MAG: rhomboid family intramembrane serine protease [Bacteroidota bacterium]
MNKGTQLKIKFREIYLPFLGVALGALASYSGFRWLFDIYWGPLPLKTDLLNFWLPMLFALALVLFWLRRRSYLLQIRTSNQNGPFLLQIAMLITTITPLVVMQNYLDKGLYSLIPIRKAIEVQEHPREKYFDLSSFQLDKSQTQSYARAKQSGRYHQDTDYYLYFACPFEAGDKKVWLGKRYTKSISTSLSDDEKGAIYQSFYQQSASDFEANDFYSSTAYFESTAYSSDQEAFLKAIRKAPSIQSIRPIVILQAVDRPFDQRLGTTLFWLWAAPTFGYSFIALLVLLFPLDQSEYKRFKAGKNLKDDDFESVYTYLHPFGTHGFLASLLLANGLIFLIMLLSGVDIMHPLGEDLLAWGANRRTEVLKGEIWRLLTAVFLHKGIFHLFMNSIGFILAAMMLDAIMDQKRVFIYYLICGILASLASIAWYENTISVGASGAIFGLFGLSLTYFLENKYPEMDRGFILIFLIAYAGLSLVIGSFSSGTDNAAHLGGLLSGVLIGIIDLKRSKK